MLHDTRGLKVLFAIFKRKLAKFLISIIFWTINFKSNASSFIKIRLFKSHLSCEIAGVESLSEKNKILILALFPRKALLPSIKRFIKFSISTGFHPVIVLNKSKDSDFFRHSLEEFDRESTILIRENIGRDFGAYQCAVNYLGNRVDFANLEKIAFFNDSIFYGKEFGWFTEMDHSSSNVSALYSNFEIKPHFQSMAFICDRHVINSNFFKSYWSNYYPTDTRRKVIEKGELEFSTLCIASGHTFRDLATTMLLKEILPFNEKEKQSLLMFGLDLLPQKNIINSILTIPDFPINQEMKTSETIHKQLINLVVTSKNISHALGLYFSRIYGFPLKLDLVKFGTIGILDLAEHLQSIQIEVNESEELLLMTRAGGSFYSSTGWDKLFRHFNLI